MFLLVLLLLQGLRSLLGCLECSVTSHLSCQGVTECVTRTQVKEQKASNEKTSRASLTPCVQHKLLQTSTNQWLALQNPLSPASRKACPLPPQHATAHHTTCHTQISQPPLKSASLPHPWRGSCPRLRQPPVCHGVLPSPPTPLAGCPTAHRCTQQSWGHGSVGWVVGWGGWVGGMMRGWVGGMMRGEQWANKTQKATVQGPVKMVQCAGGEFASREREEQTVGATPCCPLTAAETNNKPSETNHQLCHRMHTPKAAKCLHATHNHTHCRTYTQAHTCCSCLKSPMASVQPPLLYCACRYVRNSSSSSASGSPISPGAWCSSAWLAGPLPPPPPPPDASCVRVCCSSWATESSWLAALVTCFFGGGGEGAHGWTR